MFGLGMEIAELAVEGAILNSIMCGCGRGCVGPCMGMGGGMMMGGMMGGGMMMGGGCMCGRMCVGPCMFVQQPMMVVCPLSRQLSYARHSSLPLSTTDAAADDGGPCTARRSGERAGQSFRGAWLCLSHLSRARAPLDAAAHDDAAAADVRPAARAVHAPAAAAVRCVCAPRPPPGPSCLTLPLPNLQASP